MHDVERRHRHRENLRARAEAFMPASSNHFTILFLAKILSTKTRYDSGSLQLCPEIVDNIPNLGLSNLVLNICYLY